MSVEYREDRKKWGYRFYLHGKPFNRYVWNTKTEAREAERLAIIEAKKRPQLQPTAMVTASGAYLIESAKRGRSQWRIDGLHYTFNAHIVPHFGEATLITDITPKAVENFISVLKKKGLKNKTIKNIITDLRAMFNWAIEPREEGGPGLLDKNPVTKKVTRLIGNAKAVKRPINPRWFEIAAATIENQ